MIHNSVWFLMKKNYKKSHSVNEWLNTYVVKKLKTSFLALVVPHRNFLSAGLFHLTFDH